MMRNADYEALNHEYLEEGARILANQYSDVYGNDPLYYCAGPRFVDGMYGIQQAEYVAALVVEDHGRIHYRSYIIYNIKDGYIPCTTIDSKAALEAAECETPKPIKSWLDDTWR